MPCWGDPEYTFSDVERAIQQEVRKRNFLARYQLRVAEAERAREMERSAVWKPNIVLPPIERTMPRDNR